VAFASDIEKEIMRYLLLGITVLFSLLGAGVVAASEQSTTSCTRSDVLISEVDYDQPGIDDVEFVELFGRPNASLNGYELRLIDSGGTIYNTIDLNGTNILPSGYFVVGNRDLFNSPQIFLNDDSIDNNKAVVAIYDVTSGVYCNAVNYEGTVSGFSDWFNIGFDSEAHGEGRGCARAASGWWSCNRPTTPGGSNGVVAVQIDSSRTVPTEPSHLLLLIGFGLLISTPLIVRRR
jgi:hypothetical protein